MPVEKNTRVTLPPPDYVFDILDNKNICLAGTSIATGSGRAMVISTGEDTYMASIARDLAKKRAPNVMQVGVRKFSYILLAFMAVSTLIFQLRRSENRGLNNIRAGADVGISVDSGTEIAKEAADVARHTRHWFRKPNCLVYRGRADTGKARRR